MTTTFTPGDAVGVCGPAAHLIAAIELDDPRLPRLWELLSRGAADTVDAVLRALLEGGFSAMPAFALASTSGTTTRVVVRHPAVVAVTVGDAVEELSSTPGGTWSDVVVEGASAVVLRASEGTASGVQLPFHAGMAPASAVRLVLAEDAVAPAGDEPAAQPVEVEPESEVTPEAEIEPEAEVEPESEVTPEAEPAAEPAAGASEVTPHTAIWRGSEATESERADHEPADAAAEPETDVEAEVEAQPSDEPEAMTVMRPAVQPPPPAPPANPAPAAQAPPTSGGLIDGVPWLTADWSSASAQAPQRPTFETPTRRPVPPPAPASPPPPAARPTPAPPAPAPPSAADDDSDDAPTVLRAELVQTLGSAGIVGPSVLAVDCPNGHQTSAHEPTCRLCGADLPDDQEPRQIPRPALGALVLAGGDRLVLDKDAVLGRAPYEPEGSTERPHLLRVGDSGDISRQHARIMLDGWQVIVRDLGTANGTTLTLPGGSPQQLRANEDYQLEDGAEIGIADVVTLRYEVNP